MGCTARDKHIRTNRRLRSAKLDSDHGNPAEKVSQLPKIMLESGPRPLGYPIGCSHVPPSVGNCYNPNPNSDSHNPNFDNCGWGYCTEEQLEEILEKNLEFLYNEAIAKLVALGYDDEAASKSILRNGHCYGGMDVLTNILHNALAYLNGGGCCANHKNVAADSELVFTDLSQLVEYSLAAMVCLLQQVRPHLSKGDAMWCLLMSDLHVARASTIDIPVLAAPSSNGCGSAARSNAEGVSNSLPSSGMDGATSGLCRFHGGWGFGYAGTSELPVNGFGGLFSYVSRSAQQREIDCPKRFNLSPSMKSLLKRNVAAFAAGFRANSEQFQTPSQAWPSSESSCDLSKATVPVADVPSEQGEEAKNLKNQEAVNSILSKFRDLNLDENLEQVPDEHKDEILGTLANQIKDLERQLKERKEWAQQKAMQAAKKLSSDLTQLKILRMERDETQRLKKGKQTLEDTTMKRLSEMENALRKASSQVDRANAAVRQLEVENAEIRAEMEASKLSASESITTCLEVAKREKKYLKRLLNWEKRKAKMQEEIAAEKQKISDLQLQLDQINAAQKDTEAKWREEVIAKEQAATQVEEERRAKEAAEVSNKRKLEALRLKIEIDFQRHRDDLQRLTQELMRLKSSVQSTTDQNDSPDYTIASLYSEVVEQDKNISDRGLGEDRECLICMKEEVSVVFLPCAHQVVCASCSKDYGKKGKATCPCCRAPIEQRIRKDLGTIVTGEKGLIRSPTLTLSMVKFVEYPLGYKAAMMKPLSFGIPIVASSLNQLLALVSIPIEKATQKNVSVEFLEKDRIFSMKQILYRTLEESRIKSGETQILSEFG
ncbi:hypothetical protein V2J09_014814 [Rumex salicifolius]